MSSVPLQRRFRRAPPEHRSRKQQRKNPGQVADWRTWPARLSFNSRKPTDTRQFWDSGARHLLHASVTAEMRIHLKGGTTWLRLLLTNKGKHLLPVSAWLNS